MPQNPYVRTIRLFHPAEDLAIDNANPRRVRKRRPPVNPAEGLLGDDEPATPSPSATQPVASAPRVESVQVFDDPDSVAAPDSGGASPAPPVSGGKSEKFESAVLGEVPEMIDFDSDEFPEPVDL